MRRFLIVIALGSIFSSSALAGDIPSVPGPQPLPQEATRPISPGDLSTSTDPGEVSIVGTSAALSALLTVFGLLSV